MQIAIVEDEKEEALSLERYLQRYAHENDLQFQIRWYNILMAPPGAYTIVFMDIRMPQMDGLVCAAAFRQSNPDTVLIFVTNLAQMAIRGYEVDALDFIVKPVTYGPFSMKMRRAIRHLQRFTPAAITVQDGEQLRRLPVQEIGYIETEGHNILYHVGAEVIRERRNFKEAQDLLAPYHFYACNRCYLVNLSHVRQVRDSEILVDEDWLVVSRPKKKEFLETLTAFWGDGVQR